MSYDLTTVKEFESYGGRFFVAPTKANDVVAVEGSVLGGPNFFAHKSEMLSILAAELLDAGTTKRKKDALREALASRGISLSFSTGGDRTFFSGQCFPEDLPFLLSIITECLGQANFPEAELRSAKARELGRIAEEKTETRTQANIALSRMLYDSSHVNFEETLEMLEKDVKGIRRDALGAFRKQFGTQGLILAVTGDVDIHITQSVIEKTFRKLGKGSAVPPVKKQNSKIPSGGEKEIFIADKANIDVYHGATLALTKKDPRYHPLVLVSEMLGGGFASHLMQTIRERDGLTYGVRSSLSGFADGVDGYFKVWATFSPERYEESVSKLQHEIREFFSTAMTEDALSKKKEEIAGAYLISLSTTRGLANALHQLAADGRDLSYLAEYPKIIGAVTLADAHRAADLIPLSKLSLAAAGTFSKK